MPSLKEVRARIASVTSTSKITSAMKLVSAAKLRRAQDAITSFLPYQQQLMQMLANFVASSSEELTVPLAQQRELKNAAVIALSSNSSLCGAFNSNAVKEAVKQIKGLGLPKENVKIYAIGKKMKDSLEHQGYKTEGDYNDLVDKPDYDKTIKLLNELIDKFINKELDKVLLVYNHMKNTATQEIRAEQFLPIAPSEQNDGQKHTVDYILEPNKDRVILELVPKVVRLHLYAAIMDSIAAEHGARTTAMQIATDNATDLIQELTLKYNKARQAAITNELIDIVGGSQGVQ